MRELVSENGEKRAHESFTRSPAQLFPHARRNETVSKGNKSYLPSKDCATCGLPFSWRKKWERNWDEVRYCSERCRRNKKKVS